jgi:hypothetical protein
MSWPDWSAGEWAAGATVAGLLITLGYAAASIFWAYFEPTLLPSAEIDVTCKPLFRDEEHLYGELDLSVKNVGRNRISPINIRCRVGWMPEHPWQSTGANCFARDYPTPPSC